MFKIKYDGILSTLTKIELRVRIAVDFFSRNPSIIKFVIPSFLFLFAFFFRYFIFTTWTYSFLGVDEKIYIKSAQKLLSGKQLESLFLPGWPFIISLLMNIKNNLMFLREAVMFLGAFNCTLIYFIGKQVWNVKVGILASVLMSIFPEHLFYSHYLFSEVGLESIILIFTLLIFRKSENKTREFLLLAAFVVLGSGLLYKHFVVIPFSALIIIFIWEKKWKTLLLFILLFIYPLLLSIQFSKINNKDPFFWISSPIKSTQEWSKHRPYLNFNNQTRWMVTKKYFKQLVGRNPSYIFKHSTANIFNLWTPNSFIITRIFRNYYKGLRIKWNIAYSCVGFYTLVLILGSTALIFGPKNSFRSYSILNLFLLTAMGCVWFLVSRYRVPFLFVLILQAAYLIINFNKMRL
jgi:4-amino-4-deoxy-L-arabinose transferase-like glycosyltransferase